MNLLESLANALDQAHKEMVKNHKGKCKCRTAYRDGYQYKWAYWNGTAWTDKMCEAAWITQNEAIELMDKYGDIDVFYCPEE